MTDISYSTLHRDNAAATLLCSVIRLQVKERSHGHIDDAIKWQRVHKTQVHMMSTGSNRLKLKHTITALTACCAEYRFRFVG